MYQYLILRNPGHNRVYYEQAEKMALAELKICSGKVSDQLREMQSIEIAGISYLTFKCTQKLSQKDLALISRLSFFFALFQMDGEFLKPIAQESYFAIPSKISGILKYPGKTNEIFTKMMVNVAAMSTSFSSEETIRLLDPVSGRGTTLFESLVYGYYSYGVELDHKSVHESMVFMKRFLKNERYKHQKSQRQVYGRNKSEAVIIDELEFAADKMDFKADKRMKFGVVHGDARLADKYYQKKSFHLVVGDLPYGIAHGNTTQRSQKGSNTRNPIGFLEQAIPAWFNLLKDEGAICLAWNSFVLKKEKIIELLQNTGLTVLLSEPYLQFEHRVDQAIKRDIIVAVKK